MGRYIPLLLAVVAIVGLTVWEIRLTDRFSDTNVNAEERAQLLAKVPMKIGDWQGEDKPVDSKVRQGAGAVGAVSRSYRNVRTDERVDLWLIVGHSRQIAFHTPDVCYPSSGFSARGKENASYTAVFAGQPDTPFLTNTFFREDEITGRQLIRVFWTWYNAESNANDGKVVWEAPSNARWHFGNTRALYKMYFTSTMRDPMETTEQSTCMRFARDFMPVVNQALSDVHNPNDHSAATAPVVLPAATPDEAAPADEKPAAETPAADAPSASTPDDGAKLEGGSATEKAAEKDAPTANDQDLFGPADPKDAPVPKAKE